MSQGYHRVNKFNRLDDDRAYDFYHVVLSFSQPIGDKHLIQRKDYYVLAGSAIDAQRAAEENWRDIQGSHMDVSGCEAKRIDDPLILPHSVIDTFVVEEKRQAPRSKKRR